MLKYVNTGIVFQEIPNEVTLSVNISNCPCHCPNCHSKYLWEDIGEFLTIEVIDDLIKQYGSSITCLCFMGGDAEPDYICVLAQYIQEKYPTLKVGWYSGRQRVSSKVNKQLFDYIKLGPYIEHLGALKSPTTNQHLYKKEHDIFVDITPQLWNTIVNVSSAI